MKTKEIQELINTALYILDNFEFQLKELHVDWKRMAIAFWQSGDIKSLKELPKQKIWIVVFSKTRDIINYVNEHFKEICSGSYDDIQEKIWNFWQLLVLQSN